MASSSTSNSNAKKSKSATVIVVTETRTSSRVRLALTIIAGLYLATLWLEQGMGSSFPGKISPRVWIYFAQVAALFRGAGEVAIEYRAEGWSCADRRWVEIDVRPFFEIDSDTKENRFHRTMQFYRRERSVMNALDDYVVRRHNAATSAAAAAPAAIGGVRFLSLRIPYPKLGEHVERRERQLLASYSKDMRHPWYWTLWSRRYERCGQPVPPVPPTPAHDVSQKPRHDDDNDQSVTPWDPEKDTSRSEVHP